MAFTTHATLRARSRRAAERTEARRRDFLRHVCCRRDFRLSALGGVCVVMQAKRPADTLIVNGRIATLNKRQPTATTLAIRGDTIIAIGSEPSSRTCADRIPT